ncbi:MAG: hypothetical protein JO032_21830 [Alphaproteobacteria bacterium]|nr:hypothetical protein [Alphaproteobacteria bacterium]
MVRHFRYSPTVLLFLLLWQSLAFAQTKEPPQYHLVNMHTHPWFWDVTAASVIGWVIGMVKGFSGTKDWLGSYWKNPNPFAIWLLDLIVFVVVGGYVGTGIYNPTTYQAAIAAGLSWPIGLGSLATKE